MTGPLLRLIIGSALLCASAQGASVDEIRKSLVRISTTSQEANYRVPWTPGQIGGGRGAGFVIGQQRILTNAHVVSNARFLAVERENDPKKYIARVQHVAHDCDLAVLTVADTKFFAGSVALGFGGIPAVDSEVSAFGYPIGGDRMSVTRGVVSRVDFQSYSHSAADAHLAIQIDAAINPGNSGGPVLQAGKVVGVAFQGYSGDVAQNVGYMIPVPVIQRFLKDIEDGRYDRYMDLSITTVNLLNPATRQALGLEDDDRGIMVSHVASVGSSAGVLEVGDVLLSIDGRPIASDGFVELEGERVEMPEVVERKFKGDTVAFEILRNKQRREVAVKLAAAWEYLIQANHYDVQPRYVVFAGLVFQPLSRDFLEVHPVEDLRVRYFYDLFIAEELYRDRPEVVLLSQILPDPANTYLGEFQHGILDEINGVKIKTLADAAAQLKKPADRFVIRMVGERRPIVLERPAVEAARERIKERYNVIKEENLEE